MLLLFLCNAALNQIKLSNELSTFHTSALSFGVSSGMIFNKIVCPHGLFYSFFNLFISTYFNLKC